jgi:hypothetical protein
VYGNTFDSPGNKRVVEQLERLKVRAPSLTLYWERAVATQHLLTGDPKRAAELFERVTDGPTARERVGWSCTRGAMAAAYNQLGEHERARRICEETIVVAGEDWRFVAMNLRCYLELCHALAGLGELDAAKQELEKLFARHGGAQNPMTLGSLHRTAALVANAEKDSGGVERHLAEMERWFRSTRNPALIAQCDELRRSRAIRGDANWTQVAPSTGLAVTNAASLAQSVLAECRGPDERKQRALELIAEKAAVREAWLFTLDRASAPVVAARLGMGDPPGDIVDEVRSLFDDYLADSDSTSLMSASEASQTFSPVAALPRHQLFPLAVMHGSQPLLVGAVAVLSVGFLATVHSRLLSDVANQLFQAGDIGPARLVG